MKTQNRYRPDPDAPFTAAEYVAESVRLLLCLALVAGLVLVGMAAAVIIQPAGVDCSGSAAYDCEGQP